MSGCGNRVIHGLHSPRGGLLLPAPDNDRHAQAGFAEIGTIC
jgi:hypothetical protein